MPRGMRPESYVIREALSKSNFDSLTGRRTRWKLESGDVRALDQALCAVHVRVQKYLCDGIAETCAKYILPALRSKGCWRQMDVDCVVRTIQCDGRCQRGRSPDSPLLRGAGMPCAFSTRSHYARSRLYIQQRVISAPRNVVRPNRCCSSVCRDRD